MSVFDEYIKGGNPSQREKSYAWQTAIGLQDVDGLKPSDYLMKTARQNIEGDITIDEVKQLLDSYYESKAVRGESEQRTEEADKVSARITEILTEKTFNFTPDYLIQIHKRLFTGVFDLAGVIRPYNITKKEWVLDGDTVLYSSFEMIRQTLEYDFKEEKSVDYSSLNASQAVKQICKFISGIWQIHPFCEGNTRTTAVFAIKYLRNFGFNLDNEAFAQNSWYFRNALVRANYVNYSKKVSATPIYLERFFDNLLFGAYNELRNGEMQISMGQSDTDESPKCQNGPLDVTLEEKVLLKGYESGNSHTIRDRYVEPYGFTTDYIDVCAYDLEDKSNKIFKIQRIGEVEILDEPWEAEKSHQRQGMDVFRMNGKYTATSGGR